MSKKILFPTDFSAASKNAFVYALQLAESIHAEIVTAHFYQMPQTNYINVSEYLGEIYDVNELSNFENYRDEVPILRLIADENNLGHIKISHALILGDLVQEIKKLTEKENFDFIVMGTKGATALQDTLFGTIATKVMNEVNVLTLVIPEDCKYQPINKILFLTQYNTGETELFKTVLSFSELFKAHIDCLRIVPNKDQPKNDCLGEWEALSIQKSVSFSTKVGYDIEGIILDSIQSTETNLIAMHVRHKNFVSNLLNASLSKKLALHINIPILAIH